MPEPKLKTKEAAQIDVSVDRVSKVVRDVLEHEVNQTINLREELKRRDATIAKLEQEIKELKSKDVVK